MKNFFFLLCIVLISSCNSENNNDIHLFNDYFFDLSYNEKEIDISENSKNIYFDILENKNIQIPLFKCIKSLDYFIFIGLPVNTSFSEMKTSTLIGQNLSVSNNISSSSFIHKTYFNNESYFSEYTYSIEDNMVYILTVTDSKIISDSLFNQKSLFERLNSKNN
jgi:hypothetical protein